MEKKYQTVIYFFWIGLSLFILYQAYHLGLEEKIGAYDFHNPGPGLMPFTAASLLLGLALFAVGKEFFKKGEMADPGKKEGRANLGRIGIILAFLFGYLVVIDTLGYIVTTSLFLIFLFRSVGSKKWALILIVSLVTALATYFTFTHLGLILPKGILKL